MVRFKFRDSGEIWEMEEDVYQLRSGHYYKMALREMKWFRYHFHDECSDLVSICDVFRDHRLISTIFVGDHCITMVNHCEGHRSHCIWKRSAKDE